MNNAEKTNVDKTLVITKTNITGLVSNIKSQIHCNKLIEMTNFGSGILIRTQFIYDNPQMGTDFYAANDDYSILTFTENGDKRPCKIIDLNKGQKNATKDTDIVSFMVFYSPGNQKAKDLIMKYTTGAKKIKAIFLNEMNEPVKNRNQRRQDKHRDTLYHGKMVRALITIQDGAVNYIIKTFKDADALIGPESDVVMDNEKIDLRSHRWTPFPVVLEKLNRMEEIKFVSVNDRNNFTLHLKNKSDTSKILDELKISAVASSFHPSFVADGNSPWAQICIDNTISTINEKYENHTHIKKNYTYITGFNAIYTRQYLERLLSDANGNFTFEIVAETSTFERVGTIACQFLSTPHSNIQHKQKYTLSIITNNSITMNALNCLNKLKEQHNQKLIQLNKLSHELVLHSQVKSSEETAASSWENYDYDADIFNESEEVDNEQKENRNTDRYSVVINNSQQRKKRKAELPNRNIDKDDFNNSGDTLVTKWLDKFNADRIPPEDKINLTKALVSTLTVLNPTYNTKSSLPINFTNRTKQKEGLGFLVATALHKKVSAKSITTALSDLTKKHKDKQNLMTALRHKFTNLKENTSKQKNLIDMTNANNKQIEKKKTTKNYSLFNNTNGKKKNNNDTGTEQNENQNDEINNRSSSSSSSTSNISSNSNDNSSSSNDNNTDSSTGITSSSSSGSSGSNSSNNSSGSNNDNDSKDCEMDTSKEKKDDDTDNTKTTENKKDKTHTNTNRRTTRSMCATTTNNTTTTTSTDNTHNDESEDEDEEMKEEKNEDAPPPQEGSDNTGGDKQ